MEELEASNGARILGKGSGSDTAATITRRDVDGARTRVRAIVLEEFAVPAEAGIASIKDGRLCGIVYIGKPVPVLSPSQKMLSQVHVSIMTYRLVALVSALVSQCLLIGPDIVAVPGEEVPLEQHGQSGMCLKDMNSAYSSVDAQSLFQVDSNKVIVAAAQARICHGIGLV